MSDIAVKVEDLGKKYVIGHNVNSEYARFNEFLTSVGKNVLNRLKHPLSAAAGGMEREEFWALKDVSFEFGEIHVIENVEPDHDTFDRADHDAWQDRFSSGSGNRISSGVDRARKYLSEWFDPGDDPCGDPCEI